MGLRFVHAPSTVTEVLGHILGIPGPLSLSSEVGRLKGGASSRSDTCVRACVGAFHTRLSSKPGEGLLTGQDSVSFPSWVEYENMG